MLSVESTKSSKFEICRRCGALCCRFGSVNGVPVTLFDLVRFCLFLGVDPDFLFRTFVYVVSASEAAARLSEWYGFEFPEPAEPFVVRGRRKSDGSCIFLRSDYSCMIEPAKPITCKVYPVKLFPDVQVLADVTCLLAQYPELLEEEYKLYPYYERELTLNHVILSKLLSNVEDSTEAINRIIMAVETLLRSGLIESHSDYTVSGRVTLPQILRLLNLE